MRATPRELEVADERQLQAMRTVERAESPGAATATEYHEALRRFIDWTFIKSFGKHYKDCEHQSSSGR